MKGLDVSPSHAPNVSSTPPTLRSVDVEVLQPFGVAQLSNDDMFYRFLDFSALKKTQIDGMEYLISKGCFHFPKRPHLNELVRCYFYSVHPYLPVLNEDEFGFLCTGTTCESDTQSTFSVLVLQAVLFAASAVCILILQ